MTKRGLFISFEGGEGAGKTTLIEQVADYLKHKGQSLICTREPGGTPAAESIRELLVTGDVKRWDAMAETALFLAARRMHVQEVIEPALKRGVTVLCDRFSDSTMVYQGIAKGIGVHHIEQLSKLIVGSLVPDITFLIDIDPKIGLKRVSRRHGKENRFEAESLEFHHMIREGFLTLAKVHPERMVVVDGAQAPEKVFMDVKEHLDSYFEV